MSEPVLRVQNISKSFGRHKVIDNVSFSLYKGETKVIIGPSGSGKSTLLRCINMLAPPDNGSVFLESTEISSIKRGIEQYRRKIGMVFQNFALFDHLTALDNVALGPIKVKKVSKKEAYEKAMFELQRVGLETHVHKYPAMLSGGQKQRVGIARALAMDPLLMLFDEPTSALDPELIGGVLAVMQKLAMEGMTMICVTHEMGFARSVANEILFMDEGQVIETGKPDSFFVDSKHRRTKDFLCKVLHVYS